MISKRQKGPIIAILLSVGMFILFVLASYQPAREYIFGAPEVTPKITSAYALYFKLPFVMSININKVIPQEYADVAIVDEKGNKKLMNAVEFDALLRSVFNNKISMNQYCISSVCKHISGFTDLEIATALNERHREPVLMTEALRRGITANDVDDSQ